MAMYLLLPSHASTHLLLVISVNKKRRLLLQKNMVPMGVMLVRMVGLLQTFPGKFFFFFTGFCSCAHFSNKPTIVFEDIYFR